MAQKKIFMILSRVPYPLEKGDKLRAYHQIKALSKNYQISLLCLSDEVIHPKAKEELEKITTELTIFKLHKLLIYWHVFKMLFSNKPFQVGYFFQTNIKKKVLSKIKAFQPDHIYCQLIRVSEYVKDIHNIPKTLDYMDAFSKGMLRQIEHHKFLKKYLIKNEAERLKQYENRIFDYFDHHTIISQQDKEFINHKDNHKIAVIENGIDESFFEYKSEKDKSYDIVFVGNLNYTPNVLCCKFIIEELYPILKNKKPDLSILLAGANPQSKIISMANDRNGITVSGWVEDIRESYLSGKIFIAPLFIGTGLQNKLLEAMALGVPCVTTALANNALGAKPDVEILIANSTSEFIEQIELLLQNEQKYNALVTAAKKFVSQNFNWENSVEKIPW